MALFLKASSLYSIFTQVTKTFHSTVAAQVGFLKHLGDVDTVLLDLVSQVVLFLRVIPDELDDEIRSLCGAPAVVRLLVQTKISLELQLMAKIMFGNVN